MSLSERLAARNLDSHRIRVRAQPVASAWRPGSGRAMASPAALGVTFAVAVVADVTLGVFLFTMLSFLETVNAGSGAVSFIKVAGLILFVSWFAAQATRSDRESRSLLASSPGVAIPVILFVSWSVISLVWAVSSGKAALLDRALPARRPAVPDLVRRDPQARSMSAGSSAAFVLGAVMSAVIGLLQSGGARLAGGIGDPDGEAALLAAAIMLDLGLIATLPRGSATRSLAILRGRDHGRRPRRHRLARRARGARGGARAPRWCSEASWRGRAVQVTLVAAVAGSRCTCSCWRPRPRCST